MMFVMCDFFLLFIFSDYTSRRLLLRYHKPPISVSFMVIAVVNNNNDKNALTL